MIEDNVAGSFFEKYLAQVSTRRTGSFVNCPTKVHPDISAFAVGLLQISVMEPRSRETYDVVQSHRHRKRREAGRCVLMHDVGKCAGLGANPYCLYLRSKKSRKDERLTAGLPSHCKPAVLGERLIVSCDDACLRAHLAKSAVAPPPNLFNAANVFVNDEDGNTDGAYTDLQYSRTDESSSEDSSDTCEETDSDDDDDSVRGTNVPNVLYINDRNKCCTCIMILHNGPSLRFWHLLVMSVSVCLDIRSAVLVPIRLILHLPCDAVFAIRIRIQLHLRVYSCDQLCVQRARLGQIRYSCAKQT